MDIIYRKAKLEDIDSIIAMQHKLNQMLNLNEDDNDRYFKEYLSQSISNDDIVYHIAQNQNEIAGVACVDFSDCLEVDGVEYSASIPLIFVDEKYRGSPIAYDLFDLSLKEILNRNQNSLVMSIEDNNPYKYLHFSIADKLIEEREEPTLSGEMVKQYLLGITDVKSVQGLTLKEHLKRVSYTKRNFDDVIKTLSSANNTLLKWWI